MFELLDPAGLLPGVRWIEMRLCASLMVCGCCVAANVACLDLMSTMDERTRLKRDNVPI